MDTYAITHAINCLTSGMTDMRRDLIELDMQVRSLRASSFSFPAPVSLPVPPPVSTAPAPPPAIDLHSIRASIEPGLRISLRTALHADIQQGLKDDRQLTESALMIRYDAMVCKIVRDQMTVAVAELRALLEEAPVLPQSVPPTLAPPPPPLAPPPPLLAPPPPVPERRKRSVARVIKPPVVVKEMIEDLLVSPGGPHPAPTAQSSRDPDLVSASEA